MSYVEFPDWIPTLVEFASYGGDWSSFFDAVYSAYEADFCDTTPLFRGKRLGVKRHPKIEGRDATFWHMISEGSDEQARTPDIRRCERVQWARAIVEHCDEDSVLLWKNRRGRSTRILLWCPVAEYLVVLDERSTYVLFWTAYTVDQPHRKKKLQREYEAWKSENPQK